MDIFTIGKEIEGFEHAPEWWNLEQLAKEFDNYLVRIGYYMSFEKVILMEVA